MLATAWAASHDFGMLIRLDHGIEDDEYEEVIEFTEGPQSRPHLLMWRDAQAVFIQPILGKKHKFSSVAEALERLVPKKRVEVTDIIAKSWPEN